MYRQPAPGRVAPLLAAACALLHGRIAQVDGLLEVHLLVGHALGARVAMAASAWRRGMLDQRTNPRSLKLTL